MRRHTLLLACCAALLGALPAAAQLTPVERTTPRVRAGTIPNASEHASMRVLVELRMAPLAARFGRGLSAVGPRRTLDVHSSSSRAYVRALEAQQRRAAAALRAAVPSVRVGRSFQVVLDALTVSLLPSDLPALMRQPSIARVYPSLAYTLSLDRSPSVIGTGVLRQQTGADGTGLKIAVVDDGIDQTNPFFAPAGFSYPAGFPKGNSRWVTPKVIVARVFPGPKSGAAGRLAVDPKSSFHGTHVAGIAAGVAGTTAPAGRDHPRVTGLSGVAPHAWLGNYRVFTVPIPSDPTTKVANTPEIVAAFEAAVKDGMDVINFSGGGPQVNPSHDAMIATIRNAAAAGVVPVISAGNDRDDFGLGSTGSPGTAPDAISVAAVSNTHVFAPSLDVAAPGGPTGVPFVPNGSPPPDAWASADQTLVDPASITGTDGKPVDSHLCGPPPELDSTNGTLPSGSLNGALVLVERGLCPFVTKSDQAKAAGAVGVVVVDNRPGEANPIPAQLSLPGGMVADLDGNRLRTFLSTHGGRAPVRIGHAPLELETGRSGVVTSFSSGGPTAFGHDLKPDVAAPGGQILSSTLPWVSSSRFVVLDGTSMSAPHVSGSVALLLQLHRGWTPAQVKSALVSTAAPAWADTARTREAPVTLEGSGLVALPAAAEPKLFTAPVSASFDDLPPGASATRLIRVSDAGGGAATWQVELTPQATTTGASVDLPGTIAVAPGGAVDLAITARASADAVQGENFGFVVLRNGATSRRIAYFFLVDRPALAAATALPLTKRVSGSTRSGTNRVEAYRYPVAPFGNAPDTPPMVEDGSEKVYVAMISKRAANAGVAVVSRSAGARIDPFYLGAKDENEVQGFPGAPVNVNSLQRDYLAPNGAAGTAFPTPGRYFVAVDSGRDPFNGRSQAGTYVLRSWVNDVTRPSVRLLTVRVSAGRPTLVVRALDTQSGVDPSSLTIAYRGSLVGASAYDPDTGIAVFPLLTAPALRRGRLQVKVVSADFQESKNIDTAGSDLLPNTRTSSVRLQVVSGPAVNWVSPGACAPQQPRLAVAASSTARVKTVRLSIDGKPAGRAVRGRGGLWSAAGRRIAAGKHVLEAVVVDAKGRTASALHVVTLCRR